MATEAKAKKVVKDRFWHRGLKNDRVEAYVALDGNFIHLIGRPSVVQSMLQQFAREVGRELPTAELRGKRKLARGPAPMNGQTNFFDGVGEETEAGSG